MRDPPRGDALLVATCPATVQNLVGTLATICGTGGGCGYGHAVCVTSADCVDGGTCKEAVVVSTNVVFGVCQ